MNHPLTPVAVVGCGYWGKNLVRNFHSLGSLQAICDLDESRLVDLEKTYGVQATRSFDELLCQPEIRCIVIAAPATQHFELARKALLAGNDVFVEKPLAPQCVGCRSLKELLPFGAQFGLSWIRQHT